MIGRTVGAAALAAMLSLGTSGIASGKTATGGPDDIYRVHAACSGNDHESGSVDVTFWGTDGSASFARLGCQDHFNFNATEVGITVEVITLQGGFGVTRCYSNIAQVPAKWTCDKMTVTLR